MWLTRDSNNLQNWWDIKSHTTSKRCLWSKTKPPLLSKESPDYVAQEQLGDYSCRWIRWSNRSEMRYEDHRERWWYIFFSLMKDNHRYIFRNLFATPRKNFAKSLQNVRMKFHVITVDINWSNEIWLAFIPTNPIVKTSAYITSNKNFCSDSKIRKIQNPWQAKKTDRHRLSLNTIERGKSYRDYSVCPFFK